MAVSCQALGVQGICHIVRAACLQQGLGFELTVTDAEALFVDRYLGRPDRFVCFDCREFSLHSTDGGRYIKHRGATLLYNISI
jgi:hypothetical protein